MAVTAPRQRSSTKPSRRTTLGVFGIAILATAALIVGGFVLRGGTASSRSTAPGPNFSGIPQNGTSLGSPSVNVKLIEFADVQCPACRDYTLSLLPTVVSEYVRTGKVQTEFRDYPFIGDDSMKGERFLLAAAEQNKMWQLMDAFYKKQGPENSGWLTDDTIRGLASEIPGLDVDKLFARAQSRDLELAAERSLAVGEAIGLRHTPTLLVQIGKQTPYEISVATPDQVRAALDDALSG